MHVDPNIQHDDDALADDLLIGAEPIGVYLGVGPRVVYHWAQRQIIPVFKLGNLLAARKSELRRALSASEKRV